MSMDPNAIPSSIRPYIQEIANKLIDGRAALMVGAGFSRNASKSHSQQKDLPTWNELGDIFFEKIHGKKPDLSARYLNLLKLAEEIDATFGRAVLNEILITQIPDMEYTPSELHVKLLRLNWSDVFTTNYDTLLERACKNVYSKRYDVIVNQEDLVHSKKPRIVKLHGTFPSDRPLIISENDYRKYPKQFAPFINTVQQALLENTLCLFGFSADDPNFLQWIGWIHDNLGKENSPRIYMIGIFNFSEAQKRNLEAKNIVVVNLICYEEGEGDHAKALTLFLDQLSDFQKEDRMDWPIKYLTVKDYSSDDFNGLAQSWKSTRNTYPNWVILPEKNRDVLWRYTSTQVGRVKEILDADEVVDIEYCYELNWRMEKCLCPLIDNVEPVFYKVFQKYSFLGVLNVDGILEKDLRLENSAIKILQEKWVDIGIAVLRSFREKGKLLLWVELFEQLSSISKRFSQEAIAKFSYEKALYSLASHNYLGLWEDLESWPRNDSLPYWEAKRAGLLMEVGQGRESLRTLERALSYVRMHMNLSIVKNSYLWESQEAYIMYLHFCISKNIKLDLGSTNDKEYWNRLGELAINKCDPLTEMQLFDSRLRQQFIPWSNQSEKDAFDIGFKYQKYSNEENSEALKAFSFLRFLEEIGFPLTIRNFSVSSKVMVGALNRIVDYSPYLTVSLLSRYNDPSIVQEVLGRNQIEVIEVANVDILVENHLNVFFNILPNLDLRDTAQKFVARMPDMLSRFCVKCSEKSKLRIFDFIFEVYKGRLITKKIGVLLNRLFDASADQLKCSIIPNLLEIPLDFPDDECFPEPFHYLDLTSINADSQRILIPEWQVLKLLEQSNPGHENRKRSLYRLLKLDELGLIEKSHGDLLHKLVWSHVDKIGFPLDINFNLRFILKNAPKGSVNISKVFKEHLLDRDFVNDPPKSLSIYGGKIALVQDLIWISKTLSNIDGIVWSIEEMSDIIDKLTEWWNKDCLLIEKFGAADEEAGWMSSSKELKLRFKSIIDLIVKIVPVDEATLQNSTAVDKLTSLITKMEQNGVPVLRAKASFFNSFYSNIGDLLMDVESAMKQKDELILVDAFEAIFFFSSYFKSDSRLLVHIQDILQLLIVPIRWDITPHRRHSSSIFAEILRYMPEIDLTFALSNLIDYLGRALIIYREQKLGPVLIYVKNDIKLASALYQRYESTEKYIPTILEQWKEFAFDKEQFSDVANSWISN